MCFACLVQEGKNGWKQNGLGGCGGWLFMAFIGLLCRKLSVERTTARTEQQEWSLLAFTSSSLGNFAVAAPLRLTLFWHTGQYQRSFQYAIRILVCKLEFMLFCGFRWYLKSTSAFLKNSSLTATLQLFKHIGKYQKSFQKEYFTHHTATFHGFLFYFEMFYAYNVDCLSYMLFKTF